MEGDSNGSKSSYEPVLRSYIWMAYSLCVQTSSEAHPASYPMSTRDILREVNRGRGVSLAAHPI
jgi:hypothetical protein